MSFARLGRQFLSVHWTATIALGIASVFVFVLPTTTLALTNSNYSITRNTAGVSADHYFSFDLSAGIAAGQTVTITFDTSFGGVSSLTSADVDVIASTTVLSVGTDYTMTEALNVLTFTFLNPVAASSSLTFKLGTIAGGTNTITNPSTVGTYRIDVAGTFGDTGFNLVPIIDSDQVQITARIIKSSSSLCVPCIYDTGNSNSTHSSIIFSGVSQPFGTVDMYQGSQFVATSVANVDGYFTITFEGDYESDTTFSFVSKDAFGAPAGVFVLDVPLTQGAITAVDGLYLAPTISYYTTATPVRYADDQVLISGYTKPNTWVSIEVDGQLFSQVARSDASGAFSIDVTGYTLLPGYHTIRVFSEFEGALSSASHDVSFLRSNTEQIEDFITPSTEDTSQTVEDDATDTTDENVVDETSNAPDTIADAAAIDAELLLAFPGSDARIVADRALHGGDSCILGDVSRDSSVGMTDISIVLYWRNQQLTDPFWTYRESICLNRDAQFSFEDLSMISAMWKPF